jgi:hypothetical protein
VFETSAAMCSSTPQLDNHSFPLQPKPNVQFSNNFRCYATMRKQGTASLHLQTLTAGQCADDTCTNQQLALRNRK